MLTFGRAGCVDVAIARDALDMAEVDRDGLIVDVRFNSGGHVSSLILEKLARRRIGYDTSRWGQEPEPYPPQSVLGPIVALTAKAMKGDRQKCIEAGASDFIAKPVDTEQLLSLLRVWLYK